ncbi:MAG TPA: zinc-binding dehydrogenase [Candidatus Binataceae bacterium]|nr:zinc-binding dehydrogenase [Candidatus Binataceae bacterium]
MKGKIAFIPRAHTLEFHQYEVPAPEPDGLVAEVTQTNVCGSEVHMWKGEIGGTSGVMPGHEMSGRVLELGNRIATDWAGAAIKAGDRIAPVSYIVCNRCVNCVAGNQAACLNNVVRHTHPDQPPHFTATFATHYCVQPGQHFYRIPENVPDAIASSANCAMSIVYWALDKGGLGCGETLLVLGAGGLGLHAIAIATARGARAIAMDSVARRLELASAFGADEIIDLREYPDSRARRKRVRELTGYGPDAVLEVAGVPEAFTDAISYARQGGRVLEVGNVLLTPATQVVPGFITMKSLQITTAMGYPPHYLKKSLDFLGDNIGRFPYLELCDVTFPLAQAAQALDRSERREVSRAAILPQQQ